MAAKKCVIDRSGVKSKVSVPSFKPKSGKWTGGDSKTLYAFTDINTATGKPFVVVNPGKYPEAMRQVGPEAKARVATKAEAEEYWQNPLHSGWKTACED